MNRKTGLDYFSFDVDFFQDEKIQFISARFGIKGEAITIRLLCKIYRNGYYIDWNDDIALLFAKSVGDSCQHSFVKDIVYELLKRGFFDRSIFERFSILTSHGIQKRYFEASLRRKEVYYNSRLLLIDISKYQNVKEISKNVNTLNQNVDISNENADILKQSKVKESKVKDNKEDIATELKDSASTSKIFDLDSFEFKASEYLRDNILSRIPKARVPKTDEEIQKWAIHIDRMKRLDKLTEGEIRDLIKYATTDVFWQSNILSTKKLREKKDTLYAHMLTEKNKNTVTNDKQQLPKSMQGISAWIKHNGLEN